jgi:hypothetical protein
MSRSSAKDRMWYESGKENDQRSAKRLIQEVVLVHTFYT